jgi:addiction module RelE/StbE family toxin
MRVRFTKLADADLNQAYDYIVRDNPSNARSVIERIEKAIITLCEYPSLGKSGRMDGTREFMVLNTPFIVVYRVEKHILQILSVLHTSKKYPYSEFR